MKVPYLTLTAAVAGVVLSSCAHEPVTQANASHAKASEISSESRAALNQLYAQNPTARKLGARSTAVLVFPKVLKGAFVFGGEGGNGALLDSSGNTKGYYQTAGASWGLQAGVTKSGYALFFRNQRDLRELNSVKGWELGSSPNLVVVDRGASSVLTTTTADKGIYAFVFNQKGLMADVSLKGSKITRIHPGGN